jgi:DNA polymerase elongation subunit (family B)
LVNKKKQPNIVLLDIESSPIQGYTWSTYDTSVLKILEPSKILSVAWKELHSDKITCKTISDYKTYKAGIINDKELCEEVWKVLDEADICIAHHGDRFDFPKLNARFIWHGMKAPSHYVTIDTKKVCSRNFKFDSNSLNNVGQYLNLGAKVENGGFDLWVRCIAGDPEAWELMRKYNKQDVILLEKVYLALRPYMPNHPNLALLSSDEEADHSEFSCPACMSKKVTKRGFSITRTGRKQRFQCTECGSWSSGPFQRVKTALVAEED